MISTRTLAIAFAALIAHAKAGVIDNSAVSKAVQSAAVQFDGEYYITNVKTGKTLSFNRDDVTNLFARDEKVSVTLETVSGGGYTGTAIEGLGKCASAQWGFQPGDAYNVAAVSYACQIGASDVNIAYSDLATDRIAKQIWQIVPVGTSGGAAEDSSSTGAKYQVLAASTSKQQSSSDDKPSPSSSAPASQATWYDNTEMDNVVNTDRSTWICKHDGEWLSRYPDYVTVGGHSECAGRLQNYYAKHGKSRFAKRHGPAPARHNKRAQMIYAIVTSDHLDDMTTRAIGASATDTFGGYTSQALEDYDKNDPAQQWYITAA